METNLLMRSHKLLKLGVQSCDNAVGPLPVVVGYDGSQSSDTYSVAHQMDFLAQKVLNSARQTTA